MNILIIKQNILLLMNSCCLVFKKVIPNEKITLFYKKFKH